MLYKLKGFKNYLCDATFCGLGEFVDLSKENVFEIEKLLSDDEMQSVCDYAVIKNKLSGVRELNLKVSRPGMGRKALEKYEMQGEEVLPAKLYNEIATKDILSGKIMFMIEEFSDYDEKFLLELSDFLGKTSLPIIISLGRDLTEIGKLVNFYNLSPVRILEDFGFLDRKCLVYGMNYIDKDDQKLLKNYDIPIIFSPVSDAEEGKGAISLYNFVFNELTFGFSSANCYNIDMLEEAKLAIFNTNNLMHERLLDEKSILDALMPQNGEEICEIEEEKEFNIFNRKILIDDVKLKDEQKNLRAKIQKILQRIKGETQCN